MDHLNLFEETFKVDDVNSENYDRVSRIKCLSTDQETSMELDIAHELFTVQKGELIQMRLASTLNLDGTKEEKGYREPKPSEQTLADNYDYVCHGKIYRFEELNGGRM